MFFDLFEKLCKDRGVSPTRASTEIGFSKGSVSYWRRKYKEGIDAKPDIYTAQKIAAHEGRVQVQVSGVENFHRIDPPFLPSGIDV